ncbi:MAG: ComEC/Rec2 family competence protein [Actinobacteria bacterium]|nr:ComEC/Rec2 family competence protein [Actinomycetota bacterium]
MSTARAWALAGALWLGCLRPGPWWLAATALVALGAALRASPRAALCGALAALLLAGAGLAGARARLRDDGLLAHRAGSARAVAVRAVVVTEPRVTPWGAWFLVRVDTLGRTAVRERALVDVDDPAEAPALGQRLSFPARVEALGDDGFGDYVRGLHGAVALRPRSDMRVVAPAGPLVGWTTAVRQRARAAARRGLDGEQAALLTGLVVGDTRGQSRRVQELFRASGLTHLVAVSGSNVALVVAGCFAVASVIGAGARARRWLACLVLAWFVVLVRWEPSVLRAAAMVALVLGAGLLGRRVEARHALPTAVLVLLLADPMLAGQLGFALSVLATAGVLTVAPAIARRLRGPHGVRLLVGAGVAAQVGVAPLLLATDGRLPLGALPANLVAVPAASMASMIGVAAALAAQVSVPAAGWACAAARPALAVVLWSARRFSQAPALTPGEVLTPAALLLLAAVLAHRRVPALAVAAAAGAVVVAVGGALRPPAGADHLTLTAFDVGQGDALLVEAPGAGGAPTARMLVDAGPDPGAALEHLRSRRIRRLDAVALTHADTDHSGGLPAVLRGVEVGALVVGPGETSPRADASGSARESYLTARRRRVPIRTVAAGTRFRLGTAPVEVLGPASEASSLDRNERSLVLRVGDDAGVLLLTGDAGPAAQAALLRRPDLLRATVLKVPHHGGDTNAPGFLAAVDPDVSVISVGADNDHGHPHPAVLRELVGSHVLRTDRDGTVSVELAPAGVRLLAGGPGYTPAHAPASADVPDHRIRGAAAAARGHHGAGRAARAGSRTGRGRRASGRPGRRTPAGPAYRLAAGHPEGRGRARRPRAAGRGGGRAARRARAGVA